MNEGRPDKAEALVTSLAALAREQDAPDPGALDSRLQALAEGRLSAEERAALERQAQGDPDLALALELCAPVPAAEIDRLTGAVAGVLRGETAASPGAPVTRPIANDLARRRLAKRATAVLAVIATAAAAGVVLRTGGEGSRALPSYAVQITGGDRNGRGDLTEYERLSARDGERSARLPTRKPSPGASEPVRLWPDAEVEIVVRPAEAVAMPLEVGVFLRQGGKIVPVSGSIEIAPTGTMRLAGRTATLFGGADGPGALVFVVHTAGLKQDDRALAVAPAATGPGWRRIEVPIDLMATAPAAAPR